MVRMPNDAPTDAPATDYRGLLEIERGQLQAELRELGFDDGRTGLEYDANFADTSQVTAERGEAEALAGTLKETLEEVAAAIVFLLSPAASFISGSTLRVDGARPQMRMGYPLAPASQTRAATQAFGGFHRATVPKVFQKP